MQRELHIRILAAGSCRNLLALHEITTHDQLSVSLCKSYLNRWFLLNGRIPFRTVEPGRRRPLSTNHHTLLIRGFCLDGSARNRFRRRIRENS